jgi:arylsulfatase A-like enzyme
MKDPKPFFRRMRPAIFLGALCCLFLWGCKIAKKPENFLLITLDTQRADYIGAYNPGAAHTPALDGLAAEGMLFEDSWSLIPITLPSHASLFFSEPPHKVKNYNNGQVIRKHRSRPSVVNLFRKNGLLTAGFVSLGVMGRQFGLDEGFDVYEDQFPQGRWYLTAGEVNERVIPWLRENARRNFFLWVHYSDPHDPYAPPDTPDDLRVFLNGEPVGSYCLSKYITYDLDLPLRKGRNELVFEVDNPWEPNPDRFSARLDRMLFDPDPQSGEIALDYFRGWFIRRDEGVFFFKDRSVLFVDSADKPRNMTLTIRGKLLLPIEGVRDLYRREVEYMDGEIGRLFDTLEDLGLKEKTAVLVVGDHGEGLGERHNTFGDPHIGHIHYLNPVYQKVPLILRVPGSSKRGVRIAETVTLLDVAPTMAAMMGYKGLPHFMGRNLLDLKPGRPTDVFLETYKPEAVADRFSLYRFPWQLIYAPEPNTYELYNTLEDPDQRLNRFGDADVPDDIRALTDVLNAAVRDILRHKEDIPVDSKEEEMLRALGYIR